MEPAERQKSTRSGFRLVLQQGKAIFGRLREHKACLCLCRRKGSLIHFDSPCPRFLRSAGFLHPLQMSWNGHTGQEESSFPLALLPRNTLVLGNQKRRDSPPGWFILPVPGSFSPWQSQPQNISVCCCITTPSEVLPSVIPWWQCPLSPGPTLAPGQAGQGLELRRLRLGQIFESEQAPNHAQGSGLRLPLL